MKRLVLAALALAVVGVLAAVGGAVAGVDWLYGLGGRAALLGAWTLALVQISRKALYTGPGNVVGGLVAAFASGLAYGGLGHLVGERRLAAVLEVFTPAEWVPLGLTGVVALVCLWVLHAWIQSTR